MTPEEHRRGGREPTERELLTELLMEHIDRSVAGRLENIELGLTRLIEQETGDKLDRIIGLLEELIVQNMD